MAHWQVNLSGKGLRRASIDKLVAEFEKKFGEKVAITVKDATPPESRGDRFQAALDQVSDAKGEMEALRDELQEWRDGLPENLQSGGKAGELDDAISQLEDVIQQCEEVEGADVSFPGMY